MRFRRVFRLIEIKAERLARRTDCRPANSSLKSPNAKIQFSGAGGSSTYINFTRSALQ
jgi:hypothetical protein